MKIKTGDNVIVISGKDKGLSGKVLKAFPRDNKVIVEGINKKKRHQKPRQEGKKGQVVETAYPIHVSNVKKSDEAKAEKKETKPKAKKTTKAKTEKNT
jgi:large subunit ribosomal protein L24